jgi:hypothetical protein
LIEAVEAAKLLNLSLRDVSEVATACGDAQRAGARLLQLAEGGTGANDNDDDFAKNTDAEKARLHKIVASASDRKSSVGIYALDDAVTFAILGKRADLGAARRR